MRLFDKLPVGFEVAWAVVVIVTLKLVGRLPKGPMPGEWPEH